MNEFENPTNMPLLIEDNDFLFPFMITPIIIKPNSYSMSTTDEIVNNNTIVFITTFKDEEEDSFYESGVIGKIVRKVKLPDGSIKLLFQGMERGEILEIVNEEDTVVKVVSIRSEKGEKIKTDALLELISSKVKNLIAVNPGFPAEILKNIENNSDEDKIVDLTAHALGLEKDDINELLLETSLEERLLIVIKHLDSEIKNIKIKKEVKQKIQSKLEKTNKDYFLKEQLKYIQKELEIDAKDNEVDEYKKKIQKLKKFMSESAYKEINKQINKLARSIGSDSADANVLQNYVESMLEIPFGKESNKKMNIKNVESKLDKDHFGLEKVKDRIVEYFAVKELSERRGNKNKNQGTILCFSGPPGVGKTSLANSIATALKRPLIRIALGGLEDVNELRGHRRTYVGAMPGKVVQGLIDAKTINPVVVLDEIDKISRSFRGDPTSVLLEILDPEQNVAFRDYYANFDVDLSKVIFIATANDISHIPAPLRDRMEFIYLRSYTPNEKLEIAKRYLLPQEIEKHSLKKGEVTISKQVIEAIIESYTREAGVRGLRRRFNQICRKIAKKLLIEEVKKVNLKKQDLKEYLEESIFDRDVIDDKDAIGVVNGLAWTSVGGDTLKIEAVRTIGNGSVVLTGSMGDVMKESAKIAMSVTKTLINSDKITIDKKLIPLKTTKEGKKEEITTDMIYRRNDIHLHIPEGATPKDGPSAGITMTTAMVSLLTQRKVKKDIAMTGEITLVGKILPIGGLKEKLIAAYKAKIKTVLIPRKNFEKDLESIPKEAKDNLKIIPVDKIEDVLKEALL